TTKRLALEIGVRGLMNVQYAVHDNLLYILEANPRASRTVPFVSKAIGHPLAKYAARIAVGQTLAQIGFETPKVPQHYSVKEVHLPFLKFKDVIPVLGPEMKSTGESMGIDANPYLAYYRAQLGANVKLPSSGKVLWLSHLPSASSDRLIARLEKLGYVVEVHPNVADNTPMPELLIDLTGSRFSRRCLENGVALYTTLEAVSWLVGALEAAAGASLPVLSVQEWLG
ncbi:MAG: carbamoyl phosphate synthase large subunit, partial [Deinococcales bacterium]